MRRSRRPSQIRIELAPFVDVVLVLLIFFIVASTLAVRQKGLNVKLPSAQSGVDAPKGVILSVDESQTLMLDDKSVTFGDVSERIKEMIQSNPQTHVIIHADQAVPYHLVIGLLDQVRLGGCFSVVLEAEKKKASAGK
jgi:biopolymer transport protein ExbD